MSATSVCDRRISSQLATRISVLAVVICLLTFVAPSLSAQEPGAAFLLLPASPRAMALGGVGVASEGAAALFDNAGGMACRGLGGSLAVQRHIGGTSAATVALGYGTSGWTLAGGVHLLDYGAIDEVIPDPASGGEIGAPTGARLSASDFAVAVGAARQMGWLRAAISGKLVRQQVAEASGSTGAADAAVEARLPKGARVSLAIQHLGGGLALSGREAELPTLWRAGVALPPLRRRSVELRAVGELLGVRDARLSAAAGAEALWRVGKGMALAARIGLRSMPDEGLASPLTFGGGLEGERMSISYGYRGYGALGGAHRVGIVVRREVFDESGKRETGNGKREGSGKREMGVRKR